MMSQRPPFPACAFVACVLAGVGCAGPPNAPLPAAVARAAPMVSSVAAPPIASAPIEAPTPPPKLIPTLVAEKFAPAGTSPDMLYAVEGGIAVTEGIRVGLIAGDGITWVGRIPPALPGIGPTQIVSVRGRVPDVLAAIYTSTNGRAPEPTYFPLTAKAGYWRVADGGGWGWINGVARVGETVYVSASAPPMHGGIQIAPVRGPKLVRHLLTPAEAGCKAGEVSGDDTPRDASNVPPPALTPYALESSPAGTMLSLGRLCEKRGPAAEVWDKDGKTRIIDVSAWWKGLSYRPRLLKGDGDELWAFSDAWNPVLRFKDGQIEPRSVLRGPVDNVFVSPSGQLHAIVGDVIYRHDGGSWQPVARVPQTFSTYAIDDKGTLWAGGNGVYRLRPGPSAPAPDRCTTPFVHLFQASSRNPGGYTYPATRKALATFPSASRLALVEFPWDSERHVGIPVATWAEGEAVVAHLKAGMSDEEPRVFCFEPTGGRRIELGAKE